MVDRQIAASRNAIISFSIYQLAKGEREKRKREMKNDLVDRGRQRKRERTQTERYIGRERSRYIDRQTDKQAVCQRHR